MSLFDFDRWVTPAIPPGLRRAGLVAAAGMAWLAATAAESTLTPTGSLSGLKVHRTWMPNAYPSSYAIGFPSGLNFCFDPIRANLIYAWMGDYVDLAATVNGKIPRDAVIRGTVFYQSLSTSGFRSSGGKPEPDVRFRTFRMRDDIPEFEYEVDGTRVQESIRPSGDGTSLTRRFRVTTQDRGLTYSPSEPVELVIDSGPATRASPSLLVPPHSTVVFSLVLPRQ